MEEQAEVQAMPNQKERKKKKTALCKYYDKLIFG
jgi:hypothetical protein